MLIRATKGPKNLGQEMIGNLYVLQHAFRHSLDPTINTDFASFLSTRLLHSYRHLKNQNFKVKHQQKKEDPGVRRLFPGEKLEFYNTLHIDLLRLSTRSYSHNKTTDDSNILFLLNGNMSFGRIRSIFTVNGGEPLLFVAHLLHVSPLIYPLDRSSKFEYSGIHKASTTNWSFLLINIKDFVEKTVLFESPDRQHYFFRFPNLVHSS